MDNSEATVYVVEDDAAARDSIVALATAGGMRAEAFDSAEGFLAKFDAVRCGCLVLDLRLGGITGLELLERLAALGSSLPIIITTGYGDVPSAVAALQRGAFAFFEKPFAEEELLRQIRAAVRKHEQDLERRRCCDEIRRRIGTLRPKEMAVLEKLIAGKPNKLIAQELDMGLRTAELHRSNVFRKMGAHSVAELVRMALAVGLISPHTYEPAPVDAMPSGDAANDDAPPKQ